MASRRISTTGIPPRKISTHIGPNQRKVSAHRKISLHSIRQRGATFTEGLKSSVAESIEDLSRIRTRSRYESINNNEDEYHYDAEEDVLPEEKLENILDESDDSINEEKKDIDDSVELSSVLAMVGGYGRFQFFVHLVMIFASTAEVVNNLSLYFAGLCFARIKGYDQSQTNRR